MRLRCAAWPRTVARRLVNENYKEGPPPHPAGRTHPTRRAPRPTAAGTFYAARRGCLASRQVAGRETSGLCSGSLQVASRQKCALPHCPPPPPPPHTHMGTPRYTAVAPASSTHPSYSHHAMMRNSKQNTGWVVARRHTPLCPESRRQSTLRAIRTQPAHRPQSPPPSPLTAGPHRDTTINTPYPCARAARSSRTGPDCSRRPRLLAAHRTHCRRPLHQRGTGPLGPGGAPPQPAWPVQSSKKKMSASRAKARCESFRVDARTWPPARPFTIVVNTYPSSGRGGPTLPHNGTTPPSGEAHALRYCLRLGGGAGLQAVGGREGGG